MSRKRRSRRKDIKAILEGTEEQAKEALDNLVEEGELVRDFDFAEGDSVIPGTYICEKCGKEYEADTEYDMCWDCMDKGLSFEDCPYGQDDIDEMEMNG